MKGLYKINLNEYKQTKIYFQLFNVLIRQNYLKKDEFLLSNKITPSSYRRSTKKEEKVGLKIYNILVDKFDLENILPSEFDELAYKLNTIYYDVLYKNVKEYKKDLEYIEAWCLKKTVLFPIFNLFKLLVIGNSDYTSVEDIKKYRDLYKKTMQYKDFFDESLNDIIDIITILYSSDLTSDIIIQEYNTGLAYYILMIRYIYRFDYVSSSYFYYKARYFFNEEQNMNRIIYLNLAGMVIYLSMKKYNKAKLLAFKQFYTLDSLNMTGYALNKSKNLFYLSLLGLKEYENIIYLLKNNINNDDLKIICMLISLYKIDKKQFNQYILNLDLSKFLIYRDAIDLTIKYLKTGNKELLNNLENVNINKLIVKFLKAIF